MAKKQPPKSKNLPKRRGKVFCDFSLINAQLQGK
jgi:hypothetical protein